MRVLYSLELGFYLQVHFSFSDSWDIVLMLFSSLLQPLQVLLSITVALKVVQLLNTSKLAIEILKAQFFTHDPATHRAGSSTQYSSWQAQASFAVHKTSSWWLWNSMKWSLISPQSSVAIPVVLLSSFGWRCRLCHISFFGRCGERTSGRILPITWPLLVSLYILMKSSETQRLPSSIPRACLLVHPIEHAYRCLASTVHALQRSTCLACVSANGICMQNSCDNKHSVLQLHEGWLHGLPLSWHQWCLYGGCQTVKVCQERGLGQYSLCRLRDLLVLQPHVLLSNVDHTERLVWAHHGDTHTLKILHAEAELEQSWWLEGPYDNISSPNS